MKEHLPIAVILIIVLTAFLLNGCSEECPEEEKEVLYYSTTVLHDGSTITEPVLYCP